MTDLQRLFKACACGALVLIGACTYSDETGDEADGVPDSTMVTPVPVRPLPVPDTGVTSATPDARGATPPDAGSSGAGSLPAAGETQSDLGSRILTRAAAKYASVRTMRADFAMATTNPLLRTTTNSAGRIYQQRPDRIALRFTNPAGDLMLSDGTYFWVYTPSTSRDQALRSPASAGGSKAVDLQSQFLGDPVARFTHTLHTPESVDGRMADVLTLVPRGDEPFRSLKVWIDRGDSLARRFEVTERNGVVRRMELQNLQVNITLPADVFRFTPPAGVRVLEQ